MQILELRSQFVDFPEPLLETVVFDIRVQRHDPQAVLADAALGQVHFVQLLEKQRTGR